jgi:hypothetical protein
MDLDEVLDELKHFGKFQAINYLLLSVAILFAAMFEASFIFTAGDLDYRCRIPECEGTEATFNPDWIQNAVPFHQHDARPVPRRCLRFASRNLSLLSDDTERNVTFCSPESFDNHSVFRCDEWVYDGEETTVLREWGLTCEENLWKLTMVGTVNNIGQFVGLAGVGMVSDRYGTGGFTIQSVRSNDDYLILRDRTGSDGSHCLVATELEANSKSLVPSIVTVYFLLLAYSRIGEMAADKEKNTRGLRHYT